MTISFPHLAREHGGAYEQMKATVDWLGLQGYTLSEGLKTPVDAMMLYDAVLANPDNPEFIDTLDGPAFCIKAIGYDPMKPNP